VVKSDLARYDRFLAVVSLFVATNPHCRAKLLSKKFLESPAHPGLRLERLKFDDRAWSVRVTRNYRAVARRYDNDDWLWFWIGSHEEFDRRFPK
jgi:hypothetical protein